MTDPTPQPLDYFSIIHRYISPESDFYRIYLPHVTLVTNKALKIARRLGLEQSQLQFIEEAGMLHDIGIINVKSNKAKTESQLPYICHGNEGRKILEAEGLPKHALVAERHTGVGITLHEIEERDLPLPHHDMTAQSIEEKIISYADLFFSKRPGILWQEESVADIEAELSAYGAENVDIFREWQQQFESTNG